MNKLSINDSRTLVTSVYIDKSSSSAGGNSIYYTTKNTNIKKEFAYAYDYVDIEEKSDDTFYGITNNGEKHLFVIGTDGLWSGGGNIHAGFTQKNNGKSSNTNKDNTPTTSNGNNNQSTNKNSDSDSSSDSDIDLGCLWRVIKFPFKLIWWIIKAIWWIIKLALKIVTFGLLTGIIDPTDKDNNKQ